MRLSTGWTGTLISVLFSVFLVCGCTTIPGSGSQPEMTDNVSVIPTGSILPVSSETIMVQQISLVPPGPPAHKPAAGIGKAEGAIYYTASGNSTTGVRVDDSGEYHFSVVSWDTKSLQLYITDWNGGNTFEIYNSAKDMDNTSIPLDPHPGGISGGTTGEASGMNVGSTFSGITD